MSTRRSARRRTIRAAAPPRPREHREHLGDDVAGCSCPDPTYSTGFLFGLGDDDLGFPSEDELVALLRCKSCGRRPPAGWSPDGWGSPRGAGSPSRPGAGPRPATAPSTFTG